MLSHGTRRSRRRTTRTRTWSAARWESHPSPCEKQQYLIRNKSDSKGGQSITFRHRTLFSQIQTLSCKKFSRTKSLSLRNKTLPSPLSSYLWRITLSLRLLAMPREVVTSLSETGCSNSMDLSPRMERWEEICPLVWWGQLQLTFWCRWRAWCWGFHQGLSVLDIFWRRGIRLANHNLDAKTWFSIFFIL